MNMNAAATVQMIQPITQSNIQMNECKFFHYAPNYDKFYHITCQFILQGSNSLDDNNYDHGFFYNINPAANYYVTCKRFSHSLIVNILNKKIYGIDIGINNTERKELLSLNQKLDLEQDLKQILSFHLTLPNREITDRNLNSPYGHNTQTISITDSQTSFDNNFSQQTGAGYYTNNVTNSRQVNFNNIPQRIPKRSSCSGNTNSFGGNIGNNVMTTQAVLITDSQNNGFPFSSSTSAAPQNSVYHITNSPQINDSNNIPHQITDRETRLNTYRNTNSFHGNNTFTTQSVSTIDISQNYDNDRQDVNRTRDFVYTQQQVDINDKSGDTDSHNRNIGNNVTTMRLTYDDHQDINDIHYQVIQPQQQVDTNNNYGDTDSHNRNTRNNVATTQAYGMTYDHQDINDIHHQVTQPQQQVDINYNHGDTDSHNGNTENNVATTQANDMICDHQDINDINQVTQQ